MQYDHSATEETVANFVAAVEEIEQKIADLNQQKKNLYADVKAAGIDLPFLRVAVADRRWTKGQRDEASPLKLLDLYREALKRHGKA